MNPVGVGFVGFHKPTSILLNYKFGADFQFTAASVPEPSSLVNGLIGLGLAGRIHRAQSPPLVMSCKKAGARPIVGAVSVRFLPPPEKDAWTIIMANRSFRALFESLDSRALLSQWPSRSDD